MMPNRAAPRSKIVHANHIYCMHTFWQWLSQLRLRPLDETYVTFDAPQYNQLFDQELEKVIGRVRDPTHREALEGMLGSTG